MCDNHCDTTQSQILCQLLLVEHRDKIQDVILTIHQPYKVFEGKFQWKTQVWKHHTHMELSHTGANFTNKHFILNTRSELISNLLKIILSEYSPFWFFDHLFWKKSQIWLARSSRMPWTDFWSGKGQSATADNKNLAGFFCIIATIEPTNLSSIIPQATPIYSPYIIYL